MSEGKSKRNRSSMTNPRLKSGDSRYPIPETHSQQPIHHEPDQQL